AFRRCRVGQLTQVFDQPARTEVSAMLHALQVDQVDFELARLGFLDEEVAAVQVAVVVAQAVKLGGDRSYFGNQLHQVRVARSSPIALQRRKPLLQEMIKLGEALQFLGEDKAFEQ